MADFLVIGLIIENWWEISWILSMNIPSIQRPQTVSLALGGQRHWAPTTHEIKSADWQLLDESPLHHYHHPKASIFSLQSYTKGLVGATFGPLFFFLFWFIFEDFFFFLMRKKKLRGNCDLVEWKMGFLWEGQITWLKRHVEGKTTWWEQLLSEALSPGLSLV